MNTIDVLKEKVVGLENTFLLILAGGIGSRLIGIGSKEVPKQFAIANELGETWIQITVKRFLDFGIMPKNVVVITTNSSQTALAENQLAKLDVLNSNICQIASNYDYAGAMIKGSEFIKNLDSDALVINTPADQYVEADDIFYSTLSKAVKSASQGKPTIIGVRTSDLNLIKGCGHAVYSKGDLNESKKVIEFIEKPKGERAEDILKSDNSAINTGISVWTTKTLFEQASNLIQNKRLEDLKKVKRAFAIKEAEVLASREESVSVGVPLTKEEADSITKNILSEVDGWSISTDQLMEVFDDLYVSIGSFVWEDCGTYSSIYKVSKKTPDTKNAKIGGGKYEVVHCTKNLFFVPEGYHLAGYGLQDSFVAINTIYGRTVVVAGKLNNSQLLKEFGEEFGPGLADKRTYMIDSINNHVQKTMVGDLMVCFVGLNNHSVSAVRLTDGDIFVSVSNDAF